MLCLYRITLLNISLIEKTIIQIFRYEPIENTSKVVFNVYNAKIRYCFNIKTSCYSAAVY